MMQNENHSREQSETIAVVLEARKLALRCQELEQDLESQKQRVAECENELAQRVLDPEGIYSLAEMGRLEMERQKKETRTRLQAIVHFTGDRDRLQSLERMLSQKNLEPRVIASLHRKITEEFRVLYPTQPLSRSSNEVLPGVAGPSDWAGYRIRSCRPHEK